MSRRDATGDVADVILTEFIDAKDEIHGMYGFLGGLHLKDKSSCAPRS
jgi:hypothetical protein